VSRRMAYKIHMLHNEIEGPKVKVVRDGVMQNIYKQVGQFWNILDWISHFDWA
jgi:hypothetical protein